jgi:predicted TIM-barrel fold metal-dependent hydrolase
MHAGLPFYEDETFAMLFMFPNNLYVDISALTWYKNYCTVSLTEFLKKAVDYGFVNRIMFGSDEMTWPGTIGLSVKFVENADYLTEEQKRNIFYNNAARFLKLDDETIKKHHNN